MLPLTRHQCLGLVSADSRPPCQELDYVTLPFGLNLATLQLCAWCMFLSYNTNSWGAAIVGPGLLLTFTIFIHHSFKYTDPITRVWGCVIVDLWVHARVESRIGLYTHTGWWPYRHQWEFEWPMGKLPIIVRLPQLSYHLLTMAHVYYFAISGICIKTTTVPEIGPLQLFIGI
jgi:hypothetical protein